MPHSTATTLADPAGTPRPSANTTRTAALSRVVPTETSRQRDMRCTIVRRAKRRTKGSCIAVIVRFRSRQKRAAAASDHVAINTATCAAPLVVAVPTSARAALVAATEPA